MQEFAELLGESQAIETVRQNLHRLLAHPKGARRLPALLIRGETGTGKGLVARLIHRQGPRAAAAFVDINCAAIPDTLLEAEFFGFEQGAFTDARRAKPGLFQTAHRGTIFLDEVGLLPLPLQAKLLNVLEEQTVRRLGSTVSEPADVWVISATNTDVGQAIAAGRFREDLYHRLAVLTVELPPLRGRGRDVLLLAERFLSRACADYGLAPKRITPEAQARLLSYRWPGNVRQLANVMERVALLAEGTEVGTDSLELPDDVATLRVAAVVPPPPISMDQAIREHLVAALAQTGWNISRTAALLGISRNTVRARIEKFTLREDAPGAPSGRRLTRAPLSGRAPAGLQPGAVAPSPVTVPPLRGRWENRRVTFLRATLLAADDEEDAGKSSRALATLVDKLHVFGGRIDELGRRGIGAVFGLEPVEDAPRRAAHAAVAIQKAAERGSSEDGVSFNAKVGIHVAPVMVGQFKESMEIDTEARRDQWNVLDGLLARAGPGSVIASAAAASFLGRRFDFVPETQEGGVIYRLQGHERKGLGLGGEMTGFVGRGQELDLLRSRLTSARAGHGQIVGIMGEAGVGKSRLLYEFRKAVRAVDVGFFEGQCLSYGSTVPFLPIIEILRRACRIPDAAPPEAVVRKLRVSLQYLGMNPEADLPYLLRFVGLKDGTEALAVVPPESIRDRTFQILRQMFVSVSRRRPLVVAVEDAHWIDSASEGLAAIVESLEGIPLLLIVTYRPGWGLPWLGRSHATQIALQPLSTDESLDVLADLLPPARMTEPIVQLVLSKAEGNPFFLEEMAHTIREQDGVSVEVMVPGTVEEVLRARISRLTGHARRLIHTASVIGKSVPLTVLRAVAGLKDEELDEALGQLRAGDFLYEASSGPEAEYTFKHGLTQEVAYQSLLIPERRVLHAQIVAAIERLFPERIVDEVERLAQHAHQGELWEKSVAYHRHAGRKAGARSASREAVTSFEKALAALDHLGESREVLEEAVDVRFELQNALIPLGDFQRMLASLRDAEVLAERLGDQRRLGHVSAAMSHCYWWRGEPDRSADFGRRALGIASELHDVSLQVVTSLRLVQAYFAMGDFPKVIESGRWALEKLRDDMQYAAFGLPALPSVTIRAFVGRSLALVGDFEAAIAMVEDGHQLAQGAGHPYSLVLACWGVGDAFLMRGDLTGAIAVLERGLDLCQRGNFVLMSPILARILGEAYSLAGRHREALDHVRQSAERLEAMRYVPALPTAYAGLGEARLLAGELPEALQSVQQAIEVSRLHGQRATYAVAMRILGDILSSWTPLDSEKSALAYREALALGEELRMLPLVARCHLGLGKLWMRAGHQEDARAHLKTAGASFRAMEVAFWCQEVEAALLALPSRVE